MLRRSKRDLGRQVSRNYLRKLGINSSCTVINTKCYYSTTTITSSDSINSTKCGEVGKEGKRVNIIGMDKEEISEVLLGKLKHSPYPGYRLKQIWKWLYSRKCNSFNLMSDLPETLRNDLDQYFKFDFGTVSHFSESKEEQNNNNSNSSTPTSKWVLSFSGQKVETVLIPDHSLKLRNTVCVSSQVGCSLSCKFCHTGTQPIYRNLSTSEILSQIFTVEHHLRNNSSNTNLTEKNPIHTNLVTNIVYMGQGEPFYNYKNVSKSLQVLLDPSGLNYSKRRITVSTSGVVPIISKFLNDFPGVKLAISLHAANDKLRSYLVPANLQWNLDSLITVLRQNVRILGDQDIYNPQDDTATATTTATEKGRGFGYFNKVTFEYVMLEGVNDSDSDAKELVNLVEGIPCRFNLIPFNSWPGTEFTCSTEERILSFQRVLHEAGYEAPIRGPRGRDILAACGQLKTEVERKSKLTNKKKPIKLYQNQ